MPSLAHHALVDLFREQPALVPRMLELALGIRLPRGTECRATDSSLDRLRPLERRADLVLQLVRRGRPVLTIVVEVQGRPDERKWIAWADYLITARRTCPACVLVITASARVARWAARPFELGPGNTLRFMVLGPAQIEPVTDPVAAFKAPELAFLSALAHARTQPATLAAAVAGLPALAGDLAEVYYTVLRQHLPARLRPILEAHAMQLDRSKYPETRFFRHVRKVAAEMERKIGHDRGLKEGLKIGRAVGRAERRAEARGLTREEIREAGEKAGAEARAALEAVQAARESARAERAKARAEARAAREAAREEAREQALAARRAILLRLMDKSGFALSDAQRRKVERCAEARQLDRWIDRVLTASSSREVLAAPRRPKHSEPGTPRASKAAAPRRARRA